MDCLDGFVFFFQAEDGIRDIGVTGVQTCALPISFHRNRRKVTRFCSAKVLQSGKTFSKQPKARAEWSITCWSRKAAGFPNSRPRAADCSPSGSSIQHDAKWVLIPLVGQKRNCEGIGAVIKLVVASGKEQHLTVSTAGSHLSASDRRVHF